MSDVIAHFEQVMQDTPDDNSANTETERRQLTSGEPNIKKNRPGPLREFNCGPDQPKQNQITDDEQQTDDTPDDSDPRFFESETHFYNRTEGRIDVVTTWEPNNVDNRERTEERFFEVIRTADPGTLATAFPVSPFLNLDEQHDNTSINENASSIDIGEPPRGRRIIDENA